MTEHNVNAPVAKYIGFFAASYFIVLMVFSIALFIIDDSVSGIFYALALLAAGRICVYNFQKENRRIYTIAEKRKLLIGTFVSTVVINLLHLSRDNSFEIGLTYFIGQVVDLLMLFIIFGPFSKYMLNASSKTE